ncbi:MAG: cyclic nucleotide-binding domain-containing protein [Deltaproteobacteria bacterium]|nr:cyclic nucleotide-binding domain-containing protein [Deltaproteobacteria bacterium]
MQIMDDRLDEVARNLRANPIFKSMGAVEAVSVLKAGTTMACGEGEVLFAEGDPCDGFYVVLTGRFGVMGVRDGEPLALAIIGPGECIGEMSLTRATPRSATVRALSNSTVWHLAGSVFETLIAQGDMRATHILQGLQVEICRRFRDELLVGAELAARASAVDEGRLLVESLGWEV